MDNIDVAPSTSGSAVAVATDEIGGIHYPVYKIAYGADGSQTPVDSANPLPVIGAVATSGNFGNPALDVPAGNIAGTASVNKFGNNGALATAATEAVWDGSTLYSFPTTASITHIRAAVDSAITQGMVIEIQGLDTDYNLIFQDATLDGADSTTEVALNPALRRVFRKKVKDTSVTDQLIQTGPTGFATIGSQIGVGNNQTLMAIYTVPAGKTAYITNYYASLNKDSGGGDPDVVIKMWQRDNVNGYAPQIKHIRGLDSGATSQFTHYFDPYYKVTEKTDIWLNATNLSGTATADVSAGFDLYLVDN